uniref:MYND-type domain-containing protein n=1 Tax=Bionectria ochroleuca TaxID=29856 RepID=A0A8H7TNG3_BIOOC
MASTCANHSSEGESCLKPAPLSCKNCRLVSYCGSECQKEHWAIHKKDCKCAVMSETWKPAWTIEDRTPDFVQEVAKSFEFGGSKHFWGNTPAIDVLRLDKNEGVDYDKKLNLLFAGKSEKALLRLHDSRLIDMYLPLASGDLRNVIKTITSLPDSFDKELSVVLNDKEFDVFARNAIMLLLCLVIVEPEEAASAITHIWYSSLIQESHINLLQEKIRPRIAQVCARIEGNSEDALQTTWEFETSSLQVTLSNDNWKRLLNFLKVPAGLTVDRANEIRTAVTLAKECRDFRDRKYSTMPRPHRLAEERFREDGIMVPFGGSRKPYTVPNPTMFQNPNQWPLPYTANPLHGWDMYELSAKSSSSATSDRYGILQAHVQTLLQQFHSRLRTHSCSFQLWNLNATELPGYLKKGSFARIEMANVCDVSYLGCARSLVGLSPLLQRPSKNPHATMLMLFMNATREKFRAPPRPGLEPYGPDFMLFNRALGFYMDLETYFGRYVKEQRFDLLGSVCGMEMKEAHTIVDKWLRAPKLLPGQLGSRQEFDMLVQSDHGGYERYVEWKSVGSSMLARLMSMSLRG